MRRRRTAFATRLFLALFLLSALPSVALLGLATWGLHNYVELAGDVDAWGRVGETGQVLFGSLEEAGADSTVQAAAAAHEAELSRSLGLSRRFDLIASRLADLLPWAALALGLSLGAIAFWAARQLALQLGRPVEEMVEWADRLSRNEALPASGPGESRGPPEFATLRLAFRNMAERLDDGRRRALEAERLRTWTEMARRVAHEIKNPLTPLGLAIRTADAAIEQKDEKALAESLEIISQEATRLDEIARSFAQLGRLPEGPQSEIDLEELLRALMESDLPPSVSGTLSSEGAPLVRGHLTALNRVFRNLLGNAVEAVSQQADGRVEVKVAAANGEVEVMIADNGPGVPAEHRDRVWDPDFTTRVGGTGIGLALVRQTVRAHGGDVDLRDSDRGACFVVRLPAGPQEESSDDGSDE
jgi:nitrogen fixation/metabolism regulation signal transduction histidine kinase